MQIYNSISYVRRTVNFVAHLLAKFARLIDSEHRHGINPNSDQEMSVTFISPVYMQEKNPFFLFYIFLILI